MRIAAHLIWPLGVVAFASLLPCADAQNGEWAWMGGSSTVPCSLGSCSGQPGVYGTLNTFDPGNIPGGRDSAASWTDAGGNFWLFGGSGYDSQGTSAALNDLWEFDPITREWRWMGGSETAVSPGVGQSGVYGKLGSPAAGNIPGGRLWASNCADGTGHLWLFGGQGFDSNGAEGLLNDLWEFSPATNEWAWMGGSSTKGNTAGRSGVYGTLGESAAGNVPGGRQWASAWADRGGHLWLFGGFGVDATGVQGELNDVWEFDPSTREWAWVGGSSGVRQPGVYGKLGTAAPGNIPGGRYSATSWTDDSGNFWLFGGAGFDADGDLSVLNDLWMFNASTKEWTWMGGSNEVGSNGEPGVYGTLGKPAAGNIPGSRESASSWADDSGDLWLFGGYGYASNGITAYLDDLWAFNLAANEWAWVSGSNKFGVSGAYGTLGVFASGNLPGDRHSGSSWIDRDGHLWLFGGLGSDAKGDQGDLNDLWEYQAGIILWPTDEPIFKLAPGTYLSAQSVKITDATTGASIYYTLDGSTPSDKSSKYRSALPIAKTTTVKAIAEAADHSNSSVATGIYIILKPQTISWPKISGTHDAGTKLNLDATASSKLPVSYASKTPKVCTVAKETASLLHAGTCTIQASQAGDSAYGPAPAVSRSFIVAKANP